MFQTRERLSQREDEAIEIRSTISVLFVRRTEEKFFKLDSFLLFQLSPRARKMFRFTVSI